MSRTYAGYLFQCKECGSTHLLELSKPHRGIRLPCVYDEDIVNTYNKNDFTSWQGSYWDVSDIRVREVKKKNKI